MFLNITESNYKEVVSMGRSKALFFRSKLRRKRKYIYFLTLTFKPVLILTFAHPTVNKLRGNEA